MDLRLRNLGLGAKAGLTCLVLTLFGGYVVASALHMKEHHQMRDGAAGLTFTDIKGAYHGVTVGAPLRTALDRGHPKELVSDPHALTDDQREILLRWVSTSGEIAANYDNVDFAAFTPRELVATKCLSCHSRRDAASQGGGVPLEFWDDVQKVAFDNQVSPIDAKILLASTHAHASTMAVIALVLAFMLILTDWPRWLVGLLILLAGAGLLADMASWWLARDAPFFVTLIVAGGATHTVSAALIMLAVTIDLWRPARGSAAAATP